MVNYDAYSRMLTTQVELCFPFENYFFQTLFQEGNIKKVAEIGVGNGAFLSKLSSTFPTIHYEGYDTCEELIRLVGNSQILNLNINIGSVEQLKRNCYDLVILRLIVHQLQDRKTFFSSLSEKLKIGDKVIIIEPFDELFFISNELPAFNNHLKKHREVLSPKSASRDVVHYLKKEMRQFDLKLEKQTYYYVPSLLPGYKEKYYQYMIATSQILGCTDDVLNEIKQWYEDPTSFVQMGLIYFNFYKV